MCRRRRETELLAVVHVDIGRFDLWRRSGREPPSNAHAEKDQGRDSDDRALAATLSGSLLGLLHRDGLLTRVGRGLFPGDLDETVRTTPAIQQDILSDIAPTEGTRTHATSSRASSWTAGPAILPRLFLLRQRAGNLDTKTTDRRIGPTDSPPDRHRGRTRLPVWRGGTMGSTKDFVAATVADAMLPWFRRPVEDVIYETIESDPNRTDFKEIRDLVNNLRGQMTGATGGALQKRPTTSKMLRRTRSSGHRVVARLEKAEALEARVAALESEVTATPTPVPARGSARSMAATRRSGRRASALRTTSSGDAEWKATHRGRTTPPAQPVVRVQHDHGDVADRGTAPATTPPVRSRIHANTSPKNVAKCHH